MDTAEVTESRKPRAKRRFPLSPVALGIAAIIGLLALGTMIVVLTGIYPPSSSQASELISDQWHKSRTATPAAQRAEMLTVEKVGTPRVVGKDVVVTVQVTNNIKQSPAPQGTATPNAPLLPEEEANVNNATIQVFFFKTNDRGEQEIVGSGVGNVTNLKYGQTAKVDIIAANVGDYTDYVVLPDSVWTDKDPVKTGEGAGQGGSAPASATGTPSP